MTVITVNVRGVSVLVDQEQWESMKTLEVSGTKVYCRPCDVRWHLFQPRHTTYVVSRRIGQTNMSARLHRLLLQAPPESVVDHINGNGLDNRAENLRLTDKYGNAQNRRSSPRATSKYVGVSKTASGRYAAFARVDVRNLWLGRYDTEIEAAIVRDEWVRKNRPETGYLNFPNGVPSTHVAEAAQ